MEVDAHSLTFRDTKICKAMIAGAMGIHVVLLVVAADEALCPKPVYLDICRLLGIRTGAIVLTKVDLVDEEWLELEEDLRDLHRPFWTGLQSGIFPPMYPRPSLRFEATSKIW